MNVGLCFAIWSAFASTTAAACSIAPQTADEQAESTKRFDRELVEKAQAPGASIVQIQVLTTSGANLSSSQVYVRSVLSGKVRSGSIIKLYTTGSSMCGAGELEKGQKGIILLVPGKRRHFDGFVEMRQLELLRRASIIQ
jgi:hypothetical protein